MLYFSKRLPLKLLISSLVLFLAAIHSFGQIAVTEAAKSLPDKVGFLTAVGGVRNAEPGIFGTVPPADVHVVSSAQRFYRDSDGDATYNVYLIKTETGAGAYALLTRLAGGKTDIKIGLAGSAAISDSSIIFCQDTNLVEIAGADKAPAPSTQLLKVAQAFAATLPTSDDDLPVLVKHLPNWEKVATRASYAITSAGLKSVVPNQQVLDAISFDGGTEAVVANYDQSQLVIVEFTTPQLSIDNDSRIWTKIAELKSAGQPTPIAYRRVGNYSVFVFNAPDERSANALVDQVKYEQVVQWLGDDPHLYDRLQRYFTQTSAGVLVAVLKSSGLSLILCLVAGALIGTMMFRHRRTQKAAMYSDAGGSIRLNLDELTGPANTSRLLKSANSSEPDSSNS